MTLVGVEDVPGAGLDPEAVEHAARGLRADAGAVRDGGNDVAGAWAGLGASYEAPEARQLLRVMDPVRADTGRLADELERVAAVLAKFAAELREIVTRCDQLRVEVRDFRARVAAAPLGVGTGTGVGADSSLGLGGGSGLGLDPAFATENALLASGIDAVAVKLVEAERACAAAIRAVDGPPPAGGGFGGFLAGAADGAAGVAEKVANPWGEAPEPETCAGSAIKQVGTAMWTGASWGQFAAAYPFLAGMPGLAPLAGVGNAVRTEFGRSLIGWGVSGAEDGVVAGVHWSLDAADSVLTWGSERRDELWQAGKEGAGWVIARAESGRAEIDDDMLNAIESVAHFYDVSAGADDGGFPRTGEVLTAGLGVVGAHLGWVHTTIALGQVPANLLDDGIGYAGEPEPVPEVGYLNQDGDYVAGARDPNSFTSVFRTMDDAYTAKKITGEPTIRVTLREPVDGGAPVAFVTIPGTEEWFAWGDNGNPRDVTADTVTASGGRSVYADAIVAAMDEAQANLPEGTRVVPVGHSLGGMALADVLSDPAFVDKHNITDAVVFGAPIGSDHIAAGVHVVDVHHEDDVVPKLDFNDSRIAPLGTAPEFDVADSRWIPDTIEQGVEDTANSLKETFKDVTVPGVPSRARHEEGHTTITLESPGHQFDVGTNHSTVKYIGSVAEETAIDGSQLNAVQDDWIERGLLGQDEADITTWRVPVGRRD